MIATSKTYFKSILETLGVPRIYLEPEDESKTKGNHYAWMIALKPETLTRDGATVAKKQSDQSYHLREYKVTARIILYIYTKSEETTKALKDSFLTEIALSSPIPDANGFAIEIQPISAEAMPSKSSLQHGFGYEIVIDCIGGIYRPADIVDDPWLEALAAWTGSLLGSDWTIYPTAWPVGYTKPAVLWQVQSLNTEPVSRAVFEVSKRIQGTVAGRTPSEGQNSACQIAQELEAAIKIPLNVQERRYLTVSNITVENRDRENLTRITFNLSRRTQRPVDETAPVISSVKIGGSI